MKFAPGIDEGLKRQKMTGDGNSQIPCDQYTEDCMFRLAIHDLKIRDSRCKCNRFVASTCSHGSLIWYLGPDSEKISEMKNKPSEMKISLFKIGVAKAARGSVLAASADV